MASEQPPTIAPGAAADEPSSPSPSHPHSPVPSVPSPTSPAGPSSVINTNNTNPNTKPNVDADTNTRRCFICLGDEPEASLPRDWATPCGCTLEGHQACLLDWISDLEAQGKADFRCPLCKSRIRLVEGGGPFRAIRLSQHLHRLFSEWSPTVVLAFLGAGTVIGSAAYGFGALELVVGPEVAVAFLFKSRPASPFPPELQRKVPLLSLDGGWLELRALSSLNFGSLCVLPMIGPALVLNRLLFLPRILTIPVSVLLVGWNSLVDPKTQSLSWPPTLQQALTFLPAIQSSYFILYKRFLGRLEKRWDALAKRPYTALHEENNEAQAAQEALPPRQGAPQAAAVADADDDDDDDDVPDAIRDAAAANQNGLQVEVNGVGGRWTVNFLAGALLWPGVCYGMGALMRLLLPRRFVTRPARGPNTGILQERWGRSLVGGCLFVVLKDAFSLYVKYQKAMNRPHRRIKNVERRTRK